MNSQSFAQRACNTFIDCAPYYQSVFLDYEYLIFGDSFTILPYYTISAKAGNYLHLTGVNSNVPPFEFYKKCLNKTLTAADFSFSDKGIIRSKIIALPLMPRIFGEKLTAEENFTHGRVNCSIATADNQITVGFADRINARPKTLLPR